MEAKLRPSGRVYVSKFRYIRLAMSWEVWQGSRHAFSTGTNLWKKLKPRSGRWLKIVVIRDRSSYFQERARHRGAHVLLYRYMLPSFLYNRIVIIPVAWYTRSWSNNGIRNSIMRIFETMASIDTHVWHLIRVVGLITVHLLSWGARHPQPRIKCRICTVTNYDLPYSITNSYINKLYVYNI